MNAKELIKKLTEVFEEQEISKSQFFNQDYSDNDEQTIIAAVGNFKTMEYGRSTTGDHNSYEVTFFFIDHDIYLKADGYYSSWDGTDWSCANLYEVKPVEKTITVYEKVI